MDELNELNKEIKKSKDRLHSLIIVSHGDTGKQAMAEFSHFMKLVRRLQKLKRGEIKG